MTHPDLPALRALAEAALAIEEDLEELDSDETVYERSEIPDFIAAANPTTVLALLDRIAALESGLREACDLFNEHHPPACMRIAALRALADGQP